MAFSPDGKTLATAGTIRKGTQREGTLVLWDLETLTPRDDILFPQLAATWPRSMLQFTPDGKTLVTCGFGGEYNKGVQLWDVPQGKPKPRP
jgi:WD40 repeat protein